MTEQNTQQQKQYKILLIGDICDDIYQYGVVERISPEAPVPIFKPTHSTGRLGMVGNVYQNLVALGCDVTLKTGSHSKKTRFIDSRSKQQLLRIDEDVQSSPLQKDFVSNINDYDAVVISDYDKGVVTYDLIDWIRQEFKGPIFMDTKKKDIACFYGIFVKINENEYKDRWSINDSLIVTLGDRGAMYKTGRDPKHETVYPCPKVEVVDITGAGDTFLSAFTFEFLRSHNHSMAIDFANRASSITVQHFGCYAPTIEEIK